MESSARSPSASQHVTVTYVPVGEFANDEGNTTNRPPTPLEELEDRDTESAPRSNSGCETTTGQASSAVSDGSTPSPAELQISHASAGDESQEPHALVNGPPGSAKDINSNGSESGEENIAAKGSNTSRLPEQSTTYGFGQGTTLPTFRRRAEYARRIDTRSTSTIGPNSSTAKSFGGLMSTVERQSHNLREDTPSGSSTDGERPAQRTMDPGTSKLPSQLPGSDIHDRLGNPRSKAAPAFPKAPRRSDFQGVKKPQSSLNTRRMVLQQSSTGYGGQGIAQPSYGAAAGIGFSDFNYAERSIANASDGVLRPVCSDGDTTEEETPQLIPSHQRSLRIDPSEMPKHDSAINHNAHSLFNNLSNDTDGEVIHAKDGAHSASSTKKRRREPSAEATEFNSRDQHLQDNSTVGNTRRDGTSAMKFSSSAQELNISSPDTRIRSAAERQSVHSPPQPENIPSESNPPISDRSMIDPQLLDYDMGRSSRQPVPDTQGCLDAGGPSSTEVFLQDDEYISRLRDRGLSFPSPD